MDCCTILMKSLLMGTPMDIWDHQQHAANVKKYIKELGKAKDLKQLAQLKGGVNRNAARKMEQACKSRAWLTVMPRFLDNTEL